MSRSAPAVSIFIPAYNAERTLESVAAGIPASAWESVRSVWVVNDGSTDGTASLEGTLAAEYPALHWVNLPENRGYGGAVKEALARAQRENVDIAVCLHADGQYAPEEIPRLVDEMVSRRLDLLQGSRIASGGALAGGMPLYKYAAGRILTAMENIVFRKRMTDYHSGYMVYGRKALDAVPFEDLSDSFDFDLEVIASAVTLGLAVGESPIPTHYGDEVSHLNAVTYGLRVLRVLARYAFGRYRRLARKRERTK